MLEHIKDVDVTLAAKEICFNHHISDPRKVSILNNKYRPKSPVADDQDSWHSESTADGTLAKLDSGSEADESSQHSFRSHDAKNL